MIQNLVTIISLMFLEGILSLDNALVLAVTVRHLPQEQQKRALRYGMWGAFLFRALALLFLNYLLKIVWLKAVGGAYLIWLAVKYAYDKLTVDHVAEYERDKLVAGFWQTVLTVELLDIAFSVDSIFAAVGMSSDLIIVLTGGIFGIIMMRFASVIFIDLLKRWPWLEHVAYLLVGGIGFKLLIECWRHYG